MAAPSPGSVVVFLGSDPGLADRLAGRPAPVGWMSRTFLPGNLVLARGSTGGPSAEGAFPADQLMCAQRLIDLAKRSHRTVRIVDVNRPGDDRPLVERFVGPDDVLPVAVRADGQRLVGAEGFGKPRLLDFLAGA